MNAIDISTLSLSVGKHASRDDGVCLLEAVSWFAGERHSDKPACVSHLLAAYGRAVNDYAPQAVRDRLWEFIPRLVGTRGSRDVEQKRAYLFADAAVRIFLPMACESTGLVLRGLAPISDANSARAAYKVTYAVACAAAYADRATACAARSAMFAVHEVIDEATCTDFSATCAARVAAAAARAACAAADVVWDAALEVFSRAIDLKEGDERGTD